MSYDCARSRTKPMIAGGSISRRTLQRWTDLPMNSQHDALSGRLQDIKHGGEIFIVDDDESTRDILKLILSLEGFPVTCFADGETFLKQASARIPVCVFLDVVMPGRSGIDILKELRTRHYEAPIFLISAQDDTPT